MLTIPTLSLSQHKRNMVRGNNHPKKRSLWTEEEDKTLMDHINIHGKGHWNSIAKKTGLKRSGKSCRLRWMNHLNPSVNRGDFTEEEDDLIVRLHNLVGNRWSLIAGRVPGRTDNQVKNHWNTNLIKKFGIKKGNNRKVDDDDGIGDAISSSPQVFEVSDSPQRSNSKINVDAKTSQNPEESKVNIEGTANGNVEGDFNSSSLSEIMQILNCYEDFFWVSDFDFELGRPSVMESLGGY